MAPIDINNQEIDSITLNGNTDIDTVTVDGQTVFSAGPDSILDSEVYLQIGSGAFTREPDRLNFFVDNSPDGEVAAGTVDGTIDMTDVEEVYIDWEHNSTSFQSQDRSYIGVDSTLEDINRSNAETGSIDAFILNSNTNFSRRTDSLDVSALTGDYNLGKGAQVSSSNTQFLELNVYAVYGEDSGGGRVFEINIPGGD